MRLICLAALLGSQLAAREARFAALLSGYANNFRRNLRPSSASAS